MKERWELREKILRCQECELSKANTPVPFTGPTGAKVAVWGEAPGWDEVEQGQPYVGRSGQLLRSTLQGAGLDLAEIAFFNTVSCIPTENGKIRRKIRPPSQSERQACRGNCRDQLELLDPEFVLVTGAVALEALNPHLKISRVHGRPVKVGERYFFLSYHPAAALRDPEVANFFQQDLKVFAEMTDKKHKWTHYVSDVCVKCDKWGERYTDEGLAFCWPHWESSERDVTRDLWEPEGLLPPNS